MISRSVLFLVVFGFAAGIAAFEWFSGVSAGAFAGASADVSTLWFAAIVFIVGSVCLMFNKRVVAIVFIVSALSFSAGFTRSWLAFRASTQKTALNAFADEKVTLIGVIGEEQERREYNTRLTMLVRELRGGQGEQITEVAQDIKILVTTNNPKDFRYGDVVEVSGKVSLPENFYTDTGREFDYVSYLRANDISYLVKNASIKTVGRDPPSKIVSALFAAKRAFVASIGKMLPEPDSSLAAGILIDGKQSINGELQEKFQKTGLIHIVVLSGSNVSIVAEAISKACMFLPRLLGLASASVGIVLFAIITGASATVVRASIMALIVIASRMLIREYDASRGLFIASFLMLLHNPNILFYSPSFQLSFLATFAVIKIVPMCEQWAAFVRYIPDKFGLRELVVSNIVVQAFLFPILSWMTGFVSAVSLPVNLLVLPLVSITMLLSFLTAMTGLIWHVLSLLFAFAAHALLTYELTIVDYFSKFSLAEIPVSGFSTIVMVLFYIIVILVVLGMSVYKENAGVIGQKVV